MGNAQLAPKKELEMCLNLPLGQLCKSKRSARSKCATFCKRTSPSYDVIESPFFTLRCARDNFCFSINIKSKISISILTFGSNFFSNSSVFFVLEQEKFFFFANFAH